LVDFVITNIGDKPLMIPSSLTQNVDSTMPSIELTLWITSPAVKERYLRDIRSGDLVRIESVGISSQLYGRLNDPGTFHELAPNASMRIHAVSGVELNPGRSFFAGHAELLYVLSGSSLRIGTADSELVAQEFYSGRSIR
jgi:hypothetical protein